MYFNMSEIYSVEDLKICHKKLVKIHHPDLGGNEINFKNMQSEYELLLKNNNFKRKPAKIHDLKFYRVFKHEDNNYDIHLPKIAFEKGATVFVMVEIPRSFIFREMNLNLPENSKSGFVATVTVDNRKIQLKAIAEKY